MFINILRGNLGTEKLNMLIRVGDRIQTWDLHVNTMLCSFLYTLITVLSLEFYQGNLQQSLLSTDVESPVAMDGVKMTFL